MLKEDVDSKSALESMERILEEAGGEETVLGFICGDQGLGPLSKSMWERFVEVVPFIMTPNETLDFFDVAHEGSPFSGIEIWKNGGRIADLRIFDRRTGQAPLSFRASGQLLCNRLVEMKATSVQPEGDSENIHGARTEEIDQIRSLCDIALRSVAELFQHPEPDVVSQAKRAMMPLVERASRFMKIIDHVLQNATSLVDIITKLAEAKTAVPQLIPKRVGQRVPKTIKKSMVKELLGIPDQQAVVKQEPESSELQLVLKPDVPQQNEDYRFIPLHTARDGKVTIRRKIDILDRWGVLQENTKKTYTSLVAELKAEYPQDCPSRSTLTKWHQMRVRDEWDSMPDDVQMTMRTASQTWRREHNLPLLGSSSERLLPLPLQNELKNTVIAVVAGLTAATRR